MDRRPNTALPQMGLQRIPLWRPHYVEMIYVRGVRCFNWRDDLRSSQEFGIQRGSFPEELVRCPALRTLPQVRSEIEPLNRDRGNESASEPCRELRQVQIWRPQSFALAAASRRIW